MRAVIQRVLNAELSVDGKTVSATGKGYVVFLGVGKGDGKADADFLIKKIPTLRIFDDDSGKINLSVKDVDGEILLVSQFTLYADCSHGNRPDFMKAESPDAARKLYEYVGKGLERQGISVKYGVFGADMKINQSNDGPFTIVLESSK